MSNTKKSLLVIFIILFLDQTLKIWIKTHMMLGEEHRILGDWFIIHFTENNGMAFGLELGGAIGKYILSTFRILAVAAIGWYLSILLKKKAHIGLIICISMIFAGAMGNILDSAFYGLIFNESYFQVASLFPPDGGYASFLSGRVVDMLYFPIIQGHFPAWFPFWGSEEFIFFRPIFNLADSSITMGVIFLLLFQKRFFKEAKF